VLLPHAIAVTDEQDLPVEVTFANRLELPPANWLHEPAVREDVVWEGAGLAGDTGEFAAAGRGALAAEGEGTFGPSSPTRLSADVDGASTATDVLFLGGTPVADSAEPAANGEPEPAPDDGPGPDDLLGLPRRVRGAEFPAGPNQDEAAPATGPSGLPQRQRTGPREGIPRRDGSPRRGVLPKRGEPEPGADGQPDHEPVLSASPEELGSLASSLQRGWLSGRSEADRPADS
jgi:hypothetical protein